MLQLVLMNLEGTKYQLYAPPTATVKTVKNLIQDQHGFAPAQTRLINKGSVMKNDHTLTFYGLKRGDILQMITDYEGGHLPQREREPSAIEDSRPRLPRSLSNVETRVATVGGNGARQWCSQCLSTDTVHIQRGGLTYAVLMRNI